MGIGSADEDARGEERGVRSRDLSLAGRAGEDEIVTVDDGRTADDRDGRRVATGRIRLAPEHGDGGLSAVDGGRIVQSGTHAELLARGGLYADLHRTQYFDQDAPVA